MISNNDNLNTNTIKYQNHVSMSQKVACLGCQFPFANVISEKKYNGLRGSCPKCGGNWPES